MKTIKRNNKQLNSVAKKLKKARRSTNFRNNFQNPLLLVQPTKRVILKNKAFELKYKIDLGIPIVMKLTRPGRLPEVYKSYVDLRRSSGGYYKKWPQFKNNKDVINWISQSRKVVKKPYYPGVRFLKRVVRFCPTLRKLAKNTVYKQQANIKRKNSKSSSHLNRVKQVPYSGWKYISTTRSKKNNFPRVINVASTPSRKLISYSAFVEQSRRNFLLSFSKLVAPSKEFKNEKKLDKLKQLAVNITRWIEKGNIKKYCNSKHSALKTKPAVYQEQNFEICMSLMKLKKLRAIKFSRIPKLTSWKQRGLFVLMHLLKGLSNKKLQKHSVIKLKSSKSKFAIELRQNAFRAFLASIRRFAKKVHADLKIPQLFKHTLKYRWVQISSTPIKKDYKVKYEPSLSGVANFIRSYNANVGSNKTKTLQAYKYKKLQLWQNSILARTKKEQRYIATRISFSEDRWNPIYREQLGMLVAWLKKRNIRLSKKFLFLPTSHKLIRWYTYCQLCAGLKKRGIKLPAQFQIYTPSKDFATTTEIASSLLGIVDHVRLLFTSEESIWKDEIRRRSYITHTSKIKDIFFRNVRRCKTNQKQIRQWEKLLGLPWKLIRQPKLPRRLKKRLLQEIQKMQRFSLIKTKNWPEVLTEKGWGFEILSTAARKTVRYKVKALNLLWKLRETKYNPTFIIAQSIAKQPLFLSLLRELYPTAAFSEEQATEDLQLHLKQKRRNQQKIKLKNVKKNQLNKPRHRRKFLLPQSERKYKALKLLCNRSTLIEQNSADKVAEIFMYSGLHKHKKIVRLIHTLVTSSSFQQRLINFKKMNFYEKNKIIKAKAAIHLCDSSEEKVAKEILKSIKHYIFCRQINPASVIPLVHADLLYLRALLKTVLAGIHNLKNTKQPATEALKLWKLILNVLKKRYIIKLPSRTLREQEETITRTFLRKQFILFLSSPLNNQVLKTTPYLQAPIKTLLIQRRNLLTLNYPRVPVYLTTLGHSQQKMLNKYIRNHLQRNNKDAKSFKATEKLNNNQLTRATYRRDILSTSELLHNKIINNKLLFYKNNATLGPLNTGRLHSDIKLNLYEFNRSFSSQQRVPENSKKIDSTKNNKNTVQPQSKGILKFWKEQSNPKGHQIASANTKHFIKPRRQSNLFGKILEYWTSKNKKFFCYVSPNFKGKKAQALYVKKNSPAWIKLLTNWKKHSLKLKFVKINKPFLKKTKNSHELKILKYKLSEIRARKGVNRGLYHQNKVLTALTDRLNQQRSSTIRSKLTSRVKRKKLYLACVLQSNASILDTSSYSTHLLLWERMLGMVGGRNTRILLKARIITQIVLANKKAPRWLFESKFRLAHGKKRKTKKQRIPRYKRQLILKKIKKEAVRQAIFKNIQQFLKARLTIHKIKQECYVKNRRIKKIMMQAFVHPQLKKKVLPILKFYKRSGSRLKWYVFAIKIRKAATDLAKQLRRRKNKVSNNFFTMVGRTLAKKVLIHLRTRLRNGQYSKQKTIRAFVKYVILSSEENARILAKKIRTPRRYALLQQLDSLNRVTKQGNKFFKKPKVSLLSGEGELLPRRQEEEKLKNLNNMWNYFSKKIRLSDNKQIKAFHAKLKTQLPQVPLQLIQRTKEIIALRSSGASKNVFFDQTIALLSTALKQRYSSRQLHGLVHKIQLRSVSVRKPLKWWEQKRQDYAQFLAGEFTPYGLIEASNDVATTENHWVIGENWEEINLLLPQLSQAEISQTTSLGETLSVHTDASSLKRKQKPQRGVVANLLKSLDVDHFEQKITSQTAENVIENRRDEDEKKWVPRLLTRYKKKTFASPVIKRLKHLGIIRKSISSQVTARRRSKLTTFAAFKNESVNLSKKQIIFLGRITKNTSTFFTPAASYFRKKDLGGRLTELEKKQWLTFQNHMRGRRYNRLIETAEATARLIPQLISQLVFDRFDNKKLTASALRNSIQASYWSLRLQLSMDVDNWKKENLEDIEQKILEARVLRKKTAEMQNFNSKRFAVARYRFQPFAMTASADLLSGAVLWLRQYAPLNYELYAEDSDRFGHMIVPPIRVKRGNISNKNVTEWSTGKTITSPDSKTVLLLAGRKSIASARYENILLQTRRVPNTNKFGGIRLVIPNFNSSATTSFFSRMYSTFNKNSGLKILSAKLSSARRQSLMEEEGLTFSQAGSLHWDLKGRLIRLSKVKIAVPEEQLVVGAFDVTLLRSKSSRSGDFLTRLPNNTVAPLVKEVGTTKIKLNKKNEQKSRAARNNNFKASLITNGKKYTKSRRLGTIRSCVYSAAQQLAIPNVPLLFPSLLNEVRKKDKSFTSKTDARRLLQFYQFTQKFPTKHVVKIKNTVLGYGTILKRRLSFSGTFKNKCLSNLIAASNLIKFNRSVIRSALWRKRHLKLRAISLISNRTNFVKNKVEFSKSKKLRKNTRNVFNFPAQQLFIKKCRSLKWDIKKSKSSLTGFRIISNFSEKMFLIQSANAVEQISWTPGFRALRPRIWDLLTLQKNKKHRVLKRWLKDLKVGFRARFWQSKNKRPTITNEIFKLQRSRWRRLTWRDEDDSFDREGLYKAFTFHPNERRHNAWLESLLIKRSLYSGRRLAYRRLKFPNQYKHRRWIQKLRSQMYKNKLSHTYLRRRKWPTLRRYNRKIMQNTFKLRSKKAALKRARNHIGKRPAEAGLEQKGIGFLDRLDVNLLLIKIAPTIYWAREISQFGLLWVNGNKITNPNFRFTPGDWIEWDINTIRDFNEDFTSHLKKRFIDTTFLETSLAYPGNYKYYPKIKMARFTRLPQLYDFSESLRINLLAFRWYLLDSGLGK